MLAALSVCAIAARADAAAIIVNFSFSGDSGAPGTVTGQLVFNTFGTNVAASSVFILTSTNSHILLTPSRNYALTAQTNSFTVTENGTVSSAAFGSSFINSFGQTYVDLSTNGFNGLDYFNKNDLEFAIANNQTAPTFTSAAAAVPEAPTWAMVIGGFGMMGGALRRKHPRVTFA
nr:PEPxxWA-CTERM sorting domain-containing protein [Sphingomonas vulcanisoli]